MEGKVSWGEKVYELMHSNVVEPLFHKHEIPVNIASNQGDSSMTVVIGHIL